VRAAQTGRLIGPGRVLVMIDLSRLPCYKGSNSPATQIAVRHREAMSFFLIDGITRWEVGSVAEALKNVAMSEDFFNDHFPRRPVMPGTLMIEGMALLAGLLLEASLKARHDRDAKAILTVIERTKFRDDADREYADFLAGFGVHNVGHNHPRLIGRLSEELARCGPLMLNIDAPEPAATLAEWLCGMTHSALRRAVFTSSGTEAVEAAIKIARAATGRSTLISCRGGWHGLSTGALALMEDEEHRRGFGPLLADVVHVPFGDAAALDEACR
jgi:glutamate-1-semialdehyde aminotransferase